MAKQACWQDAWLLYSSGAWDLTGAGHQDLWRAH